DRGLRRDRRCGLHHHRRSSARLWRGLFPAHPRQQEPPRGAHSGGAVRSRYDGGGSAQRGHARRQGGGADGRALADHERRRRATAFIPARLRPGLTFACGRGAARSVRREIHAVCARHSHSRWIIEYAYTQSQPHYDFIDVILAAWIGFVCYFGLEVISVILWVHIQKMFLLFGVSLTAISNIFLVYGVCGL